jgi:hypothetical protein
MVLSVVLHWLDLVVGFAIPTAVAWQLWKQTLGPARFRRFLIGFFIGLCWEIPFGLAEGRFYSLVGDPPFRLPLLISVCHSFWDAAIFGAGVDLCAWLLGQTDFLKRFQWRAQGIMLAWGVGTELLVDLVGSETLWVFHPSPWNPVILTVGAKQLTLVPQLVWLVAPFVYYRAILRFRPGRANAPACRGRR